jgi:hypothetical protein
MSAVVGSAIAIIALFIPPQGEIDTSVLILVAQILVFAATLLGVDSAVDRILIFKGRKEL